MVEKTTPSSSSTPKKRRKKNKNNPNPHLSKGELSTLISHLALATASSHRFLSQNDLLLHPTQTLTLESSIKSIALSLSKLHSLLSNPNPNPIPTKPLITFSPPSPCWFQRFLSTSHDSDPRWIESFRMSKPSFKLLLQTLTLDSSPTSPPPSYQLGVFLFRLAHSTPFKSSGRRFGMSSAAACRSFYAVCKTLNDKLSNLFESPSNSKNRISFWFPNCLGAIVFRRFFVDRGFGNDGSLIVQGVVDFEGRFMDVSTGWLGTMTPDTILRQSNLFSRVEESEEFLNGPKIDIADGNSVRQYLLGDSCCPNLPWLITPFSSRSKDEKGLNLLFNSAHSCGMELVNHAFGRVLGQWRLLSMRWKKECLDFFPYVIIAGCLLHNFIIKCRESMLDEAGDYLRDQRFVEFDGKKNESGESVRDTLASHLNLVSQRE
ncbi:LOW protein: nuclease-like protein [Tasmannia lanceolata]|uniref:LOW protein: nuclease-like protein n=1 Tax=Tasmannia lanceolata TaxID=3420 RepID=UPI004063DE8C